MLGSKKHRYPRCSLLDTSKKRDTFTGVSHAIDANGFLWSLSTSSCIWDQHPSPMCPWAIVHLQKSQTLGTTSSKLWLFLLLQCFSLVSVNCKKGTQPRDHRSIHMLLKYVKLRSHCVENKAGTLTKAERQIDDLSSPAFDAAYDCEDIFAQSPHRWLPYLKLGAKQCFHVVPILFLHDQKDTMWELNERETCLTSVFALVLGVFSECKTFCAPQEK